MRYLYDRSKDRFVVFGENNRITITTEQLLQLLERRAETRSEYEDYTGPVAEDLT